MRFDIYGHFEVEVVRENGQWAVYRTGDGLKRKEHDIVIPAGLESGSLVTFLDDVYHEFAEPGAGVTRLE